MTMTRDRRPTRRIGFRAEMRIREVAQTLGGSRACERPASACALIVGVSGCGEDDFENDPRPPSPVELTAAIDKDSVSIAPSEPRRRPRRDHDLESDGGADRARPRRARRDDQLGRRSRRAAPARSRPPSRRATTRLRPAARLRVEAGAAHRRPARRVVAERPAAALVAGFRLVCRVRDQRVDPVELELGASRSSRRARTARRSDEVLMPVSADLIACACWRQESASSVTDADLGRVDRRGRGRGPS